MVIEELTQTETEGTVPDADPDEQAQDAADTLEVEAERSQDSGEGEGEEPKAESEEGKETPEQRLAREEEEAAAKVREEEIRADERKRATEKAKADKALADQRAYEEGVERAWNEADLAIAEYIRTTEDDADTQATKLRNAASALKGQFGILFGGQLNRAIMAELSDEDAAEYDKARINFKGSGDALRFFKEKVQADPSIREGYVSEAQAVKREKAAARKAVDEYKADLGSIGGGVSTDGGAARGGSQQSLEQIIESPTTSPEEKARAFKQLYGVDYTD